MQKSSVNCRCIFLLSFLLPFLSAGQTTITLDGTRTYQTFKGFGARFADEEPGEALISKYTTEFPSMYYSHVGLTVTRIILVPEVLRQQMSVQDISFSKFQYSSGPAQTVRPHLEQIKKIKALAGENFILVAAVRSPPAWMKTNNNVNSGGNLKADCYPHFAKYLSEWIKMIKADYGLEVDWLNPAQEPLWENPWESCVYTPQTYAQICKTVDQQFTRDNIVTELIGPEHVYDDMGNTKQLVSLMRADPGVARRHTALGYHASGTGRQLMGMPVGVLGTYGQSLQLPLWQCQMSQSWNAWENVPNGENFPGALDGCAASIYNDLVHKNVEVELFNYILESNSGQGLYDNNGPTCMVRAIRQYSNFIKPGAVRLRMNGALTDPVAATAFIHPARKQLSIVILNQSREAVNLSIECAGITMPGSFEAFRSNQSDDMKKVAAPAISGTTVTLNITARSMMTLVGQNASLLATTVIESGRCAPFAVAAPSVPNISLIGKSIHRQHGVSGIFFRENMPGTVMLLQRRASRR
jgi:O-glycosyl hydrolase